MGKNKGKNKRRTAGQTEEITAGQAEERTDGETEERTDGNKIENKIECYEEEGKHIVKTYCRPDENQPTMFPPAPNLTKYIDKYQEHVDLSEDNLDDKKHQDAYEAEVMVYRAIEGLEENIVVLHGLDYTHGQYQMLVGDHNNIDSSKNEGHNCKKNRKDKEGEHDFLVIGRNYVVIIEVKNIKHFIPREPEFQLGEHLPEPGSIEEKERIQRALTKALDKSCEQGTRAKTLIDNIIYRVGGNKDTTILHFSAFPNFKKEFKDEFELDEDNIIFKEDIDCIGNWWKENVTESDIKCPTIYSTVSHVLLALWCMNQDNVCNRNKFCLRECIRKTDEQLREALITQERDNPKQRERFKNSAVIPAPNIIKEYLKVKYLTNQQDRIFKSDQKFLWINGPAGSGKTILILGKIIELAKAEPKKKIILFKPSPTPDHPSLHYLEPLEEAGVKVAIKSIPQLNVPDFNSQQYVDEVLCCQTEDVVILQFTGISDLSLPYLRKISDIITTVVKYRHVFIDDTQALIRNNYRSYYYYFGPSLSTYQVLGKLINTLSNPPEPTTTMWCACDIVQMGKVWYPANSDFDRLSNILQRELAPEQLTTLSTNLRNTWDISIMVSVIREDFIQDATDQSKRNHMLLPNEDQGHFIHGPKPVIHVVYGDYEKTIPQIVKNELDKLCDSGDGQHNIKIGLIVPTKHGDTADKLVDIATQKNKDSANQIAVVVDKDDSYSREWTAVLVVYPLREVDDIFNIEWLSRLYILLSRGRVYCSLILLADSNGQNQDFLDRLKSVARIKHHYSK